MLQRINITHELIKLSFVSLCITNPGIKNNDLILKEAINAMKVEISNYAQYYVDNNYRVIYEDLKYVGYKLIK